MLVFSGDPVNICTMYVVHDIFVIYQSKTIVNK